MNKRNDDWTHDDDVQEEFDAIRKKIIDDPEDIDKISILLDYLIHLCNGHGSEDDYYYIDSIFERSLSTFGLPSTNIDRVIYNAVMYTAQQNVEEWEKLVTPTETFYTKEE